MTDVVGQIKKSSEDFINVVWPVVGKGFGRPIPVETVTANSFAKELDVRAGIDVWLVGVDGHMRGLASRVQWPRQERSFDTFTIRMRTRLGNPTEYHKRRAEIAATGTITPHYFCQAYVSTDRQRLIAAALGRMRDVIAAVECGVGRMLPPNSDGTQGWAVPWSALQDQGCQLAIWPPRQADLFDATSNDWPEVAQPGSGLPDERAA